MRVLWFTNTPSMADEYLKSSVFSGGWMKSLERQIQNEVELHIAFHYHENLKQFRFGNTTYHPIYSKITFLSKIKNLLWSRRIYGKEYLPAYLRVVAQVEPDVIHIHGTENSFSLIQESVDLPIVVSIQGLVICIYEKYKSVFNSKLMSLSLLLSMRKLKKLSEFEKNCFRNTKYYISKSDWSSKILSMYSPTAKIFELDNILRDSFYNFESTNQLASNNNCLIITTTLADSYLKGIDVILKTNDILEKMNINYQWNIIGINPNAESFKYYKKKFSDFLLENKKLKLLGKLPEKDVVNILLQSSIYVTASRIENSPNNLTEALILGLPCIASDVGGTSTFIKNGVNGLLFPDGDHLALASSIMFLMNHRDLAISMGVKAREASLIRHNKERIGSMLLSIYREIKN